jgi:hypothetical protein
VDEVLSVQIPILSFLTFCNIQKGADCDSDMYLPPIPPNAVKITNRELYLQRFLDYGMAPLPYHTLQDKIRAARKISAAESVCRKEARLTGLKAKKKRAEGLKIE